jgi:hypothetical protein
MLGTDPTVSTKKLNQILVKQKSQKKIDSKILQKIEETLTDYHARKKYDSMLHESVIPSMILNPSMMIPSMMIPFDVMKIPSNSNQQSYMKSMSTSMTLNSKGNYNVKEQQIVNNNGKVDKRQQSYELLPSGKKIPMIASKKIPMISNSKTDKKEENLIKKKKNK